MAAEHPILNPEQTQILPKTEQTEIKVQQESPRPIDPTNLPEEELITEAKRLYEEANQTEKRKFEAQSRLKSIHLYENDLDKAATFLDKRVLALQQQAKTFEMAAEQTRQKRLSQSVSNAQITLEGAIEHENERLVTASRLTEQRQAEIAALNQEVQRTYVLLQETSKKLCTLHNDLEEKSKAENARLTEEVRIQQAQEAEIEKFTQQAKEAQAAVIHALAPQNRPFKNRSELKEHGDNILPLALRRRLGTLKLPEGEDLHIESEQSPGGTTHLTLTKEHGNKREEYTIDPRPRMLILSSTQSVPLSSSEEAGLKSTSPRSNC